MGSAPLACWAATFLLTIDCHHAYKQFQILKCLRKILILGVVFIAVVPNNGGRDVVVKVALDVSTALSIPLAGTKLLIFEFKFCIFGCATWVFIVTYQQRK